MSKRRIAKEILLLVALSILLAVFFFITDHLKSESFGIENALNYKIERAQDSINVIRENDDYRKHEYEEIKKKGNAPPILEKIYKDVESRSLNKTKLNKQLSQISNLNSKISNYRSQITDERFSYWRKIDEGELTEVLIVLFVIVYPIRLIIELIVWSIQALKKEKTSN